MQNHTGYICLTFLNCAFSNGCWNRQPQRMQNHTGYICLTFLRCVLSNVSSNCLQNLTDGICLTVLHKWILKVFSNWLSDKPYKFLSRGGFSPVWPSTWFFKALLQNDLLSQMLQVRLLNRLLSSVKELVVLRRSSLHNLFNTGLTKLCPKNGSSPVWRSLWLLRIPLAMNLLWQELQELRILKMTFPELRGLLAMALFNLCCCHKCFKLES